MHRTLSALAVTLAALSAPAAARAHSAMCTEVGNGPEQGAALESQPNAVPEPARVALPVVIRAAPVVPSIEPTALPSGDIPWCVSPDDPRCQPLPRDASPTPMHHEAPVPALAVRLPAPDGTDAIRRHTPATGLFPAAGHGSPLERPPQTGRR